MNETLTPQESAAGRSPSCRQPAPRSSRHAANAGPFRVLDLLGGAGARRTWLAESPDGARVVLKELSIASYCGEPVETMARLCEDSAEAKRTIAAAIKSFNCKIGPDMQLDLAGTALNWTTSRNARNMGDFARKYLEKKL